jgi:serine/threonine-protein kinase
VNPDAISLNTTNNNAGTLPYMAPERFVQGWHSSPRSDIFSLGMLWVELLSGKLPFNPRTNLLPQILSGDYYAETVRLLDSTPTQSSTKTIILSCIHPDPESRISSWSHLLRTIKPRFLTQLFH